MSTKKCNDGYVRNPVSGRCIKVGGPKYNELVKSGLIKGISNNKTKKKRNETTANKRISSKKFMKDKMDAIINILRFTWKNDNGDVYTDGDDISNGYESVNCYISTKDDILKPLYVIKRTVAAAEVDKLVNGLVRLYDLKFIYPDTKGKLTKSSKKAYMIIYDETAFQASHFKKLPANIKKINNPYLIDDKIGFFKKDKKGELVPTLARDMFEEWQSCMKEYLPGNTEVYDITR